MKTLLINLSNHPLEKWSEAQVAAAKLQFVELVDLPHPNIPPEWELEEVDALAQEYAQKCFALANGSAFSAHIMGELTFCLCVIQHLQLQNIVCIASTTDRIVEEEANGIKRSTFQFVRFRPYPLCYNSTQF